MERIMESVKTLRRPAKGKNRISPRKFKITREAAENAARKIYEKRKTEIEAPLI